MELLPSGAGTHRFRGNSGDDEWLSLGFHLDVAFQCSKDTEGTEAVCPVSLRTPESEV